MLKFDAAFKKKGFLLPVRRSSGEKKETKRAKEKEMNILNVF